MGASRAPRTPWLVRAMLTIGLIATPVLLFPYVTLDRSSSRIDNDLLYPLLVVHVFTAAAAMLLGALQLVPRIRRHRAVHRAIGRTFLALGTVAFVATGTPLALTTPHGDVTRYGVLVPALLWPGFAVAGFLAIRGGDVAGHRAWMIRLYAVTFFAITARIVVPILFVLQLPVLGSWYDGDVERAMEATIPVGQWLGWIVNLAVAEVVLRRRVPDRGAVESLV